MRSLSLLLMVAAFGTGCAGSIRSLPVAVGSSEIKPSDPSYTTSLQLNYLGSGGWLLRRGGDAIMTGPFYSNPGSLRVGLGFPISSKTNQVGRLLPDAGDVAAILVGHAHYDHLMDVPYVARYRETNAIVYGSETMGNILAGAHLGPGRVKAVESGAGILRSGGATGIWHQVNTRVRFMALRAEHAPHFLGMKFYKGEVISPLEKLPTNVHGWKEGQTLAYLIDFLGEQGGIEHRVFYHDSAVNCPCFGGLPGSLQQERRPDVDIVCMASFDNVSNYPEYLVRSHQPRHVLVGHWEDFFRSPLKDPRVVPLTDGKKFLEKLTKACPAATVILPRPGAWFQFPPEN